MRRGNFAPSCVESRGYTNNGREVLSLSEVAGYTGETLHYTVCSVGEERGLQRERNQRPYIIEMMHSYTLPM